MCFGIAAIVLLLAAGRMVSGHLQSYTNSPNAPISGGVSEPVTASLVQQAVPIAPAVATTLRLTFASSTIAGNLVTLEVYGGSAPYVSNVSGMGCPSWTQIASNNVSGIGSASLYACNVVTPDTTVTISLPSSEVAGIAGQEFSGFQVSGYQFGHDSSVSATSQETNLPNTASTNELIVIIMALSSNFSRRQIKSPASPWNTLNSTDGANNLTFAQSYQFVGSLGKYKGTWSWPTPSNVVVVGGAFPATSDESSNIP
jgi:hypothetical protein